MKHILIASLCILPLEGTATDILQRDTAINILLNSVNLELTDYVTLQSDATQKIIVDSTEAEADFLFEERLAQFSDELQIESNLSLNADELVSEKEEANTENIAPSRALSVRYLGNEGVHAPSQVQSENILNQPIMGIEESNSIPVDFSSSNAAALIDYSVEEGGEPVLAKLHSTAAIPTAQYSNVAPVANSSASAAPTASIVSGGGVGAAFYNSAASNTSAENTPSPTALVPGITLEINGLFTVPSENRFLYTIANESAGADPQLQPNYYLILDGYEKDGVKATMDGNGYAGLQLLFLSNYTNKPTVTVKNLFEVRNFEKNTAGNAMGAAITMINGGGSIIVDNGDNNPVSFKNNTVSSTSGHASGGAIYLSGGPSIGNLHANFINNRAITLNSQGTSNRYERGGAIAVGVPDGNPSGYGVSAKVSSIGSITGNFTDNKAAFGGAIYTGEKSSIGIIKGVFERNIAENYNQVGHSSGGDGGAIRAYSGNFGVVGESYAIDADFYNNVANALSGNALGGAISLWRTELHGALRGDFSGNIAFSKSGSALGGAVVIRDQSNTLPIQFTDVSFENNIAGTGTDSANNVKGAALYITQSTNVTITAAEKDVLISDNYTVTNSTINKTVTTTADEVEQWTYTINEGSPRDYTAIYLDGSNLTLETTAGSNNTITINDGIDSSSVANTGILTVNDASHANVENEYGIFLNGELGMKHLIVETGGVELGQYTHSDGTVTTGSFSNSANLTVQETGRVKTNADYLKNVGTVDLQGVDRDTAALINLTGGKLVSDINPDGAREGHVAITGSTIFGVDPDQPSDKTIVNADTISILNTLKLMEATTVNTDTLLFYGYDEADVNNTNHIVASPDTTFSFDKIELNFATANPGDIFEIIVSDGTGQLTIDYDFSKTVVFTVDGQQLVQGVDKDFIVRKRADGGIDVEILIHVPPPLVPEPSTVTLSLVTLSALLARRRRKRD